MPELLAAVCHAQKGETTGMIQSMKRFQYDWGGSGNSVKHPNFGKWTIDKAKNYAPFSAGAKVDQEHWMDGIKKTTLK